MIGVTKFIEGPFNDPDTDELFALFLGVEDGQVALIELGFETLDDFYSLKKHLENDSGSLEVPEDKRYH